jgi:hypothetical protein
MRGADGFVLGERKPSQILGLELLFLAASAALLLAFIAWRTIDFDEGYFFQGGVQATQTGLIGFPWADALNGAPHLYIPLNALDSLLNWPLAYLPQRWWLIAGRLISALAVCAGVLLLYREQRRHAPSRHQLAVLLFLTTCLPLILCGRTIRPEGIAFLGVCAALVLAAKQDNAAAFGAGLAVSLTVLAHAVHGVLAGCVILGFLLFLPAPTLRAALKRAGVYCAGVLIPIVLFYAVYCALETPASVWREANLLVSLTPRYVTSFAPGENIAVWLQVLRGQANMWPLILFALVAVMVPSDWSSPQIAAVRFLKIAIVAILLFWIFLYPKKAYGAVVPLLPVACLILFSCTAARWPRLLSGALIVCLAANAALVARYHWRLLGQPTGTQQILPVAQALEREGVLLPHAAIMGKLWLLFVLPRDVTLWDVTVFPVILGKASGQSAAIEQAIRRSDAVALEWERGHWLDALQAQLAARLAQDGWRDTSVSVARYFQPGEIRIFVPPAGAKPTN